MNETSNCGGCADNEGSWTVKIERESFSQDCSRPFIDMWVEVFDQGLWQELHQTRLSSSQSPFSSDDEAALQLSTSGCWEPSVCLAGDLVFRQYLYSITPAIGKRYRVRLTNQTGARLGVVLEIDGLNTASDEQVSGDASDTKWVLAGHLSTKIEGWQVTPEEAMEFYFTLDDDSHSPLTSKRGEINAYVYVEEISRWPSVFPDPCGATAVMSMYDSAMPRVGTGAGAIISQGVSYVTFDEAIPRPVEKISILYRHRPLLGITCLETTGYGIQIGEVFPGSLAYEGGLKAGDVISRADGQLIHSCEQLSNIIQSKAAGDYLILKVHRTSGTFTISIKMGG